MSGRTAAVVVGGATAGAPVLGSGHAAAVLGSGRAGSGAPAYRVVLLAAVLSLGHHLDHVVRGTHVGWPLTPEPTPFTYSLVVYPLLLLGLALSRSGRVGPGSWALLSGGGALFLAAVHLGPGAVEPLGDVVAGHASAPLGRLAVAELLALLGVLLGHAAYAGRTWWRGRPRGPAAPPPLQVRAGLR